MMELHRRAEDPTVVVQHMEAYSEQSTRRGARVELSGMGKCYTKHGTVAGAFRPSRPLHCCSASHKAGGLEQVVVGGWKMEQVVVGGWSVGE